MQQLTHAGRAIRSRAPRVSKTSTKAVATEQVFQERPKATLSETGEQPVRKKKAKPSAYGKKTEKLGSKADVKAKDKAKKKAKAKKKKSNAKVKTE